MNNWESRLNCPFQISLASTLIHFSSLPIVIPPRSTSYPYCLISSLLTYSSCSLPISLFWPSPHLFPPLSSRALLLWILLWILWRVVQEGMGCSHGWPAGLSVSSVSKTRCCFRFLLGAVSLSLSLSQLLHSPHTHTLTHSPPCLSLSLCFLLRPPHSPPPNLFPLYNLTRTHSCSAF